MEIQPSLLIFGNRLDIGAHPSGETLIGQEERVMGFFVSSSDCSPAPKEGVLLPGEE